MFYVGIDIAGSKRGQAVAVMDEARAVTHIWHGLAANEVCPVVRAAVSSPPVVAIDAPRSPSNNPNGKWGRECDRQAHRMKRPIQWTPPSLFFRQPDHNKEWMEIGFRIFKEFEKLKADGSVREVLEVFPSASYGCFGDLKVTLPLNLIHRKAKTDQLDAVCCALTAWCYGHGRYDALGNPEEGQIIIPAEQVNKE